MMKNNPALQFHRFQQLDSTNAKAKELILTGAPHGTVVVAEEQSQGRGRLGRAFFSPKGSGIYLSMILRPEDIGLDNGSAVLLTTAASVAVTRAVKRLLDLDLRIKWVNDLYYEEKKVCGILAEGVIDSSRGVISAVVIGIGLNYKDPSDGFPDDLKDIAGALFPADATPCSAPTSDQLAEAIAGELWDMIPELTDRSFLTEYKERSMVLGRQVRIFPSNEAVTAVDIDPNGGLVIRHCDGNIETLTTGEISLRIV